MFLYKLLICLLGLTYSAARERVTLPDVDRHYLEEMLIGENPGYTSRETDKLIYELENFYTVIRDDLYQCGPPKKIDAVYHHHVLNTHLYRGFCHKTFGRFVDHVPFWSGNVRFFFEKLLSQLLQL